MHAHTHIYPETSAPIIPECACHLPRSPWFTLLVTIHKKKCNIQLMWFKNCLVRFIFSSVMCSYSLKLGCFKWHTLAYILQLLTSGHGQSNFCKKLALFCAVSKNIKNFNPVVLWTQIVNFNIWIIFNTHNLCTQNLSVETHTTVTITHISKWNIHLFHLKQCACYQCSFFCRYLYLTLNFTKFYPDINFVGTRHLMRSKRLSSKWK